MSLFPVTLFCPGTHHSLTLSRNCDSTSQKLFTDINLIILGSSLAWVSEYIVTFWIASYDNCGSLAVLRILFLPVVYCTLGQFFENLLLSVSLGIFQFPYPGLHLKSKWPLQLKNISKRIIYFLLLIEQIPLRQHNHVTIISYW